MATLYGDTSGTLSGKQKGAAQVLVGTDDENNSLFGDAGVSITNSAKGSDDTLTGGDNSGSGTVSNTLRRTTFCSPERCCDLFRVPPVY